MRGLAPLLAFCALSGCSDSRGGYEGESGDVEVFHVRDLDYHRPVIGPRADEFKATVSPILQNDKSVHSAYFLFATGNPDDGERATLVVIADGSVNPTKLIDEILEPTKFVEDGGGVDIVFLGGRDEDKIREVCQPFFER